MDSGYGNYTTTSYGGQGGMGGGGGFMPGEMNSPAAGRQEKNHTLRPVTIKQLLEASQTHPEAPFQIDGADLGYVLCVGQVRNISTQSTNVTYKIDDGTGEIEAKKWIESAPVGGDDMDLDGQGADKQNAKKKIEVTGYVKAFGTVKVFGNKRYLGAHSVRPLTDINELNVHFLEATAAHLFFKHGPPPPKTEGGAAAGNAYGAVEKGAGNNAGGGPQLPPHLSATARRVYNMLKNEPQSNEGLHMQNISAKLNLPSTDVIKAGNELLGDGLIFSTVDEYTWAILEF
ncbi:replication factor-a protein [Talaromyces proteolyticus]|uniref:Replication factor-a protein n=1 Tax=Talaromyces proteolyticus TaxID=1131652 RepID=A0AAD4KZ92_9EURO|nr:replication factor-a protein [Talaromyces proteolyticus]KAH8700811.1 replication factor-a protein [Talaromyces proteolyticus]